MPVEHLDRNNFDEKVLENSAPVLVDFYADWCGPCRFLAPIIDEISDEYGGKVVVAKVNVDQEPSLAAKYQVRGIPTLAFFSKGAMVEQIVGAVPKERIASKLDKLIMIH